VTGNRASRSKASANRPRCFAAARPADERLPLATKATPRGRPTSRRGSEESAGNTGTGETGRTREAAGRNFGVEPQCREPFLAAGKRSAAGSTVSVASGSGRESVAVAAVPLLSNAAAQEVERDRQ